MVHLWDVAKLDKQSKRERYSHRKRSKATMVEGINYQNEFSSEYLFISSDEQMFRSC